MAPYKVYEPELDMNRRGTEYSAEDRGWRRFVSAMFSFAGTDRIIRRPKRSIDRDHQEFPFAD